MLRGIGKTSNRAHKEYNEASHQTEIRKETVNRSVIEGRSCVKDS